MTKRIIPLLILSISLCHNMLAQDDDMPIINPTATYTNYEGESETSTNFSGNAPLTGVFMANATNTDGWNTYYEWRFTLENETEPYLIRYEQDTEYTFTEAGTHIIVLYATFTRGSETIEYTADFWGNEMEPLRVTISESLLIMPNAFSPNNDQKNDTYKVKEYQSLVEFHAAIYNRWGQKLYEWDDPAADGWDGTFHGRDVKQGVYFVVVEAKGADGRIYHIRRDVNLLRGYTDSTTTGPSNE
ncbi:MAG: gliding motility-associated C-terminal domain-containing protein [Prevotella sp.]|nr:gliding motility-associated C-terminal domain-containing protein [Prevotella sp.]